MNLKEIPKSQKITPISFLPMIWIRRGNRMDYIHECLGNPFFLKTIERTSGTLS